MSAEMSTSNVRPISPSPSGVVRRRCLVCRVRLQRTDQHSSCFMCLGPGHAAVSASCASCLALPREESERRRAFSGATAPRPDSSQDEESEIDWAPLDLPPVPAEWGGCDVGDGSEDGSLLTLDEAVSQNREPDRFPLDHMPRLYSSAAAIMNAPLPPQPDQAVEDFTSVGANTRGRRRKQPTLCPRMDPIVHYATREWPKPLAAKRPAMGYGMYCSVQDWSWTGGVPDIEDSVRMALLPSASVWPGARPLLPSERDRMSLAMLDRCYANAAQVVALANNMAFITGALDRSLSAGQTLSGDLLTEARTTSAALLRMSQAFAVDGGRTMAAAQVGARHLWLGLADVREAEKRQLLDLPVSQTSLFGPDMRVLVDRLESMAKDSARLATHLAPRREAHQAARSLDRGRRHSAPHPRSTIHRPLSAREQRGHRRAPYSRGGRGSRGFSNKSWPAFNQYSLSESHLGANSPRPPDRTAKPAATVSGPRCVARFDFEGEHSDELSFSEGDTIQLKAFVGQDWARGKLGSVTGIFPLNFVEIIQDLPPGHSQQPTKPTKIALPGMSKSSLTQETSQAQSGSEWSVALYDFSGNSDSDLSFEKGDRILVTKHIDEEWSSGRLNGQEGIFPRAFVSNTAGKTSSHQNGSVGGVSAKALYDYESDCDEELSLKVGDMVTNIEIVDDEWFLGDLGGKRALVPKNYVEVL